MQLTKAQSQIASDNHRFRVVNCGRRFGKTYLSVLEMVAKAVYGKDRYIAYIAPTYQQARDIAWQELKKVCTPIAKTINESRLEIIVNTVDAGTSTISLRGWESIETLRGQKFHFIVLDEIASMRNWNENWEQVIRPTLTDYRGEVLFISTPKGFNHFYDLYNKQDKDTDYKSFHFTSYDNHHMPKEEIDKAKQEMNEDAFAQEYMADFRKQQGLVYKEFSRDYNVYDGEPARPRAEYLGGVDFGFRNPAAVIHAYFDTDGHYWITDEFYKTERTEEQVCEYVRSCGFEMTYPDPENASAIEVLNRKGVNVQEVVKGKGSVKSGIDAVRNLFKQNRLHIHKSCVNLIWELETYSYKEKKPDNNEPEEPVKENDHACDALRYIIMSRPDTAGMSSIEKYMLQQARMNAGVNYSK